MADNNCAKVSLIACMVLVWGVMIAINVLSTIKAGRDIGRYNFTVNQNYEKKSRATM